MDLQRPIPVSLQGANLRQAHKLRDELAAQAATIGATCLYIKPGIVDTDITLEFDVAPNEAVLDAAIAAYPRSAANIGASVALTPNTAEHITTIQLAPGDHISINVYVHVTLVLSPTNTRDMVIVGLAPIWRETDGTVRWATLQFVGSGQIPGFTVDLSAAQLDGNDTGVSISLSARAGGDLRIVGININERTRGSIKP